MTFPFRIVEHKIPCQHIREYPSALLDEQETTLHLAVKQYIPLDNPNPQPGDVTIIGAHANGFPKELYEPLWEDMLKRATANNFRIRGIWIADVAQQGYSGVLNEELLGNEPGWNDHSRDLLHMINLKRDEMPRPIIGIGHSMGGNNLVNLSYIHPRLFTTLILIDPVLQLASTSGGDGTPSPAQLSTYRRDVWPSRKAAAKGFQSSKFYQSWDPRVLERWIEHGLRDMPTPTQPAEITNATTLNPYDNPVTLRTTRHQEVFTFMRPNYEGNGFKGQPIDRRTHADINPVNPLIYPFYRYEPTAAFIRLPELRPSALYILGGKSDVGGAEGAVAKQAATGTGIGGSGGGADGRVKTVVFEEIGHLVAMEVSDRTAEEACKWIGTELERWRSDEEEFNKKWRSKSRLSRQTIDKMWEEKMGPLPGRKKKPSASKL